MLGGRRDWESERGWKEMDVAGRERGLERQGWQGRKNSEEEKGTGRGGKNTNGRY